ncbi:MAG: hypothetical protein ABMA14_27120 [Hyphomonadaceae bacterium]
MRAADMRLCPLGVVALLAFAGPAFAPIPAFAQAQQNGDRIVLAVTRQAEDATASLTMADGTEVSLWGRNLTDEDYALPGYGFIGCDTFRSQPATWDTSVRSER